MTYIILNIHYEVPCHNKIGINSELLVWCHKKFKAIFEDPLRLKCNPHLQGKVDYENTISYFRSKRDTNNETVDDTFRYQLYIVDFYSKLENLRKDMKDIWEKWDKGKVSQKILDPQIKNKVWPADCYAHDFEPLACLMDTHVKALRIFIHKKGNIFQILGKTGIGIVGFLSIALIFTILIAACDVFKERQRGSQRPTFISRIDPNA